MHVVLGDGEMTRRELVATLADLMEAAVNAEQSFWFLVQGKATPTDTDKALVTWLSKNEVYYEVVTDDRDSMNELYAEPQETHDAKKLGQKVVGLLESKPEEGENADILALFSDVNDATAPEDRWLNAIIQQAFDAGYPTRALNDGLVEIDLSITEAEPEPEPTPVKKSVAKKQATRTSVTAADTDVPEEEAAEPQPASSLDQPVPSREVLEDMEPSEVKEIAAQMGIVLPPRTRATTYIDHILGENKAAAPAVEVTEIAAELEPELEPEPQSLNGFEAADVIAERVVDLLLERLAKVLAS